MPQGPDNSTLLLLLIDGNTNQRTYLAEQLKSCSSDYRITEAADGQSGLDLCRSQRVDCVVLEGDLPDRSGFEILMTVIPRASNKARNQRREEAAPAGRRFPSGVHLGRTGNLCRQVTCTFFSLSATNLSPGFNNRQFPAHFLPMLFPMDIAPEDIIKGLHGPILVLLRHGGIKLKGHSLPWINANSGSSFSLDQCGIA